MSLKISKQAEGAIKSERIKIYNITCTTSLMHQEGRKKYGMCVETNESVRVLEGTENQENIGKLTNIEYWNGFY